MSAGSLFCSAEYLEPLHASGCVTPAAGWTRLDVASAAPCYAKTHSWGEFVFDHAFARAYQVHGQDYYPKLVCAVPFTPVPGPRLGSAGPAPILESMRSAQCSSAHVLFTTAEENALLEREGWLRREQTRYVWSNAGYADFEGFLAQLNSKRRKNIRSERRQLAASTLRIEWRPGASLSEADWQQVFRLYIDTYARRGMPPYLNLQCLRGWAANLGERMQFCLALDGEGVAAMAFYFADGEALYGRHWGTRSDQPGLHFELCVYQGIERAIAHKLGRFDAGVQGEHKLLRGFTPELSLSAHWFAHAGFREAIADYLRRERRAVQREVDELAEHAGYRQTG